MSASETLCVCGEMLNPGAKGSVLTGKTLPEGGLRLDWLTVHPDGQVTLMLNKTEMGQGVGTALAMIVAEELDADLERVGFLQADYDPKYDDPGFGSMLTGGSTSVRSMTAPLREAAAAAREMLKGAAAKRFGVATSALTTEAGVVVHGDGEERISYGELAEEAAKLSVPDDPPLKDPASFRYLGKCARRMDVPVKVAGTAVFGADVRVPGMLHAALARPVAYGARATSWNADAARAVPGVVDVVETELGPAVLAGNSWAAWQGREALAAQWSEGAQPALSSEVLFRELADLLDQEGVVARSDGDAAGLAASSTRKVSLTFRQPFLAHAPIEPMNCTAHVRKDGVDVWGPSQYQTGWAQEAAKLAGLPVEKIAMHTTLAGGGFGRKAMLDCLRAAMAVSKAAGKPVQVLYDRPEEFHYDYLRPGNMARVEAGLAEDGSIAFWWQRNASASVLAELLSFMLAETGYDFTSVEGSVDMEYAIPAQHIEWSRHETPVPIGFWRSVGSSQNCFVRESVLDELARTADEDALDFRLRHLAGSPRMRGVLELAAEKFGWGDELPEGRAAGIACDTCFGSWLAHVAEVSLDEESGKITVHRVVAAIDCGQTVNPLNVVMQVEGAIVMGLSALLGEEVRFDAGGPSTKQFGEYPVLRMGDTPRSIEVHIVDSREPSGGVGEPGLPGVLPAVANALRTITGERITALPLRAVKKEAGKRA